MKFKIEYDDPKTLERTIEYKEFESDNPWEEAEVWVRVISDNGWYRITTVLAE